MKRIGKVLTKTKRKSLSIHIGPLLLTIISICDVIIVSTRLTLNIVRISVVVVAIVVIIVVARPPIAASVPFELQLHFSRSSSLLIRHRHSANGFRCASMSMVSVSGNKYESTTTTMTTKVHAPHQSAIQSESQQTSQ
jgi:hypothetical protein